ncbi:MAG: flagellar hook-associated protein FlgK [Krumholzibacteria bacterium]|nr:flagellar hook-associated protein FlgK [Candidatus Krumholzibacteria bacterium]
MSGLNAIMDTGLSALFSAQAGLATVGHNIANASSPGYSRQQVLFAARRPRITADGAIGRGVEIAGIRRIQDEFLANNMRVQSSRLASYTAVDGALYEIEAILGSVDNDHLADALNKFFNSWNGLAQPPVNTNLKQNVVAAAQSLVQDFHAVSDNLDGLEKNLNESIQAELGTLNSQLRAVAELNKQIMQAEVGGHPANDLRDQRDFLILGISEMAEVAVLEREDGSKDLIMSGRTIVSRGSVTELSTREVAEGGSSRMMVVTQDTLREVALSTGRIEGLLTSRDVHVTQVRDLLDKVAATLVREVNALHTQGRTPLSSGLAFFTGDSMHTIAVNTALVDQPGLVATGRTIAESDNALALALANLGSVSALDPDGETVLDYYRSAVVTVASNRASYEFMVDNQQNVVDSLEAKIASTSGVSLDEEGANMVKYQNGYNAAARVISAVQEMYDTLLNMV